MHIYHTPPPYLSRSSSGPSANPATSLDLAHRSRAFGVLDGAAMALPNTAADTRSETLHSDSPQARCEPEYEVLPTLTSALHIKALTRRCDPRREETPAEQGFLSVGDGGLEPSTSAV